VVGTLVDANGNPFIPTLPVAFTTFAVGQGLFDQFNAGPAPSMNVSVLDFFNSAGFNHEFLSPNGTDAFSFNQIGIPASGLLTGQDCCKSQEEVDLFGGQLGNYEGNLGTFDGGCVDQPFRWCDNIDNVDPTNFTLMS